MSNINIIIDVLATNNRGERCYALPGQCFLYHKCGSNAIKNEVASIRVQAALMDSAGNYVKATQAGLSARFLAQYTSANHMPLVAPGGEMEYFSPTALDLLKKKGLVPHYDVAVKRDIFEGDFTFAESTIDSVIGTAASPQNVPMLYVECTAKAVAALGQASVIKMYCAESGHSALIYKDMCRLPMSPILSDWATLAKQVGCTASHVKTLWNIAMRNTLLRMDVTEVYLGWEPTRCPTLGQPGCHFGRRMLLTDYEDQFRSNTATPERYRNMFSNTYDSSRDIFEPIDIFRGLTEPTLTSGCLPF